MIWDVAIAGGGPAAAAAALQLARAGVRTIVVERGDDSGDKPGESLAPAAKPLLEQLGIADDLLRDGHLPCHGNRSVWGSDRVDELPFVFSPYGHGWHLDRRLFERRLNERACEAGALRVTDTSVLAVRRDADLWTLTCRGGLESVQARFLLDGTGRASRIARLLGAHRVIDDPLVALVAFYESPDGDHDSYTLVEAAEHGWWYSATLPSSRLAAMFITDPPARAFAFDPPPHTCARIEGSGYRMTAPPRVVDAGSARLDCFAGEAWLAIGDAAVSLDPLSSHGLAAALHGGMLAAEAILTGDSRRYVAAMEGMWQGYATMRRRFYAEERRWAGAGFWARRATPSRNEPPRTPAAVPAAWPRR
ncbi:MAG TPA: tryptophan 7-halogenase [Thermoanaerobaculia bacterium]|nr:tryptophan 7-halogenase [Thermoanaerobaculia bacterium]